VVTWKINGLKIVLNKLIMKKIFVALLCILSINSFSQQPIFATIGGGDLYSFDIVNCTRRFIGSTDYGFGDIAFTPNGQLYGIVSGQLYQIDTTTANATLIGDTGIGAVTLVGLNDTTVLAEWYSKLYSISTIDGASTYIDTIGFGSDGDLTWYDDDLYIVTGGGGIVKIVLNETITAIESATLIGASIPTCEGAVTASFEDDYNYILGFNAHDLIKICHIDGTYVTICQDLNYGGTPGAASIRLPKQSYQPTDCFTADLAEKNVGNQFFVFPNPAINELNIQSNFNESVSYQIFNSFGQVVQSGFLLSENTTVGIDQLARGLYFLELKSATITERQSFMVVN
jgi:hypothetical protein